MSSSEGRKTIVLGVSGGIAAYKAAELVRRLRERDLRVRVVMTRNACRFVSPLTFASLSGEKVFTDLFSDESAEATLSSSIDHIGVAQEADLLLVAPATANTLAKFAHGLADDFLTTTYLAYKGPTAVAPAMNVNMWAHEATAANLKTLRGRGVNVIEPEAGDLACGMVGPGRLADPERIAEAAERLLRPVALDTIRDLAGKTVLITAGPTREPVDPVRYLSNRSSGSMGYALAAEARDRGAEVILISGPVDLPAPHGCRLVAVETAEQMHRAVMGQLSAADVAVMAAAVADFRPADPAAQKIKKSSAPPSLALEPTVDILSELGRLKGRRVLVGFAAETGDLHAEGRRKLLAKNCDLLVANPVGDAAEGTGFDSDENQGLLLGADGEVTELPRSTKREMAARILDAVAAHATISA